MGGKLKKLTPEAERELQRYEWPGNVRELEHVVRRLAILTIGRGDDITAQDVRGECRATPAPSSDNVLEELGDGFDLERVLDKVRYHYVRDAQKRAGQNKTKMASLLGFTNRTPLRTLLGNLKQAGYELDDT
jgi:two-component system response regulator AtoC